MKTNAKKCIDCEFFEPLEKGNQGTCRRYPATLTITLLPQPDRFTREVKVIRREDTGWPIVTVNGWCGEWKPEDEV